MGNENHPASSEDNTSNEHTVDIDAVLVEGSRDADEVASETQLRAKTQLHDVEELRAGRLDAIAKARVRLDTLEEGTPEYSSTEKILEALKTALQEYEGQMGAADGENTPGEDS